MQTTTLMSFLDTVERHGLELYLQRTATSVAVSAIRSELQGAGDEIPDDLAREMIRATTHDAEAQLRTAHQYAKAGMPTAAEKVERLEPAVAELKAF